MKDVGEVGKTPGFGSEPIPRMPHYRFMLTIATDIDAQRQRLLGRHPAAATRSRPRVHLPAHCRAQRTGSEQNQTVSCSNTPSAGPRLPRASPAGCAADGAGHQVRPADSGRCGQEIESSAIRSPRTLGAIGCPLIILAAEFPSDSDPELKSASP